jgi:hypothetical protein
METNEGPKNTLEVGGDSAEKLKSLRGLWAQWIAKDGINVLNAINSRANFLIEKYGENGCKKYRAYHLLIGSTPESRNCVFFDFPEEDSVGEFLREKIKPK